MPDSWEKKYGLNPDNANDCKGKALSDEGYTNIEMYINELAGDPVVFNFKTGLRKSNTIAKYDQLRAWQNAGTLFLTIDSKMPVIIDAIDISGRLIRPLYKGIPAANTLRFGRVLNSGIYLLRVRCDGVQKIVSVAGG